MARVRNRKDPGPEGQYRNGYNTFVRTAVNLDETCTDEVLPGNGHYFEVSRYEGLKRPRVNGDWLYNGLNAWMRDHPLYNYYHESRPPFRPSQFPAADPPAALISTLLKMTNPSRPYVDVTVFAAELKELPELILKRSNDIGRDIASGRLSAEFGWKPLIGDIQKLLQFSEALDQRTKEVEALMKSGLRRKRILRKDSESGNRPLYLSMNETHMRCESTDTWSSTRTITGFVKWFYQPSSALPLSLPGDARTKAIQATFGLTIDPATIWELLPFSWLADWCSNAGDYLLASRNTVGAVPSRVLLMEYTKTANTVTSRPYLVVPGTIEIVRGSNPWHQTWEWKKRTSGSLSLTAQMPFLSVRQASILADVVTGFTRNRKIR